LISGATSTADSREADGDRSAGSFPEELGGGKVGCEVGGGLEETMSTSTSCVDDTFWNPLTVERG
jgi:hypothetical protein